jgi:hypothetical protein
LISTLATPRRPAVGQAQREHHSMGMPVLLSPSNTRYGPCTETRF